MDQAVTVDVIYLSTGVAKELILTLGKSEIFIVCDTPGRSVRPGYYSVVKAE